jgi:hypothetical protein
VLSRPAGLGARPSEASARSHAALERDDAEVPIPSIDGGEHIRQ